MPVGAIYCDHAVGVRQQFSERLGGDKPAQTGTQYNDSASHDG